MELHMSHTHIYIYIVDLVQDSSMHSCREIECRITKSLQWVARRVNFDKQSVVLVAFTQNSLVALNVLFGEDFSKHP